MILVSRNCGLCYEEHLQIHQEMIKLLKSEKYCIKL